MIPVRCRTNLDIRHYVEKWPIQLPARPMVGDIIRSAHKWVRRDANGDIERVLELQVCRVTWISRKEEREPTDWYLEVELTLIPSRWESVTSFTNWYHGITK